VTGTSTDTPDAMWNTTHERRSTVPAYQLSQLETLEAEAVHIMREVAGEFDRPVLLFSGGKDSVVMLHLAAKAFAPAQIPFPLLHVDTGHNFPEVMTYRDEAVEHYGVELRVASVQDFIDSGRLRERPDGTRNPLQTVPLLDAIDTNRFDAVFGGGRRDEEKARAKERVFSLRDEFGQWDPKRQRPELWDLYTSAYSPCRTGPRSTSGSTSPARTSRCRRSTTPTSATCSCATACGSPPASGADPSRARRSNAGSCAIAPWVTCPAPAQSTPTLRLSRRSSRR
jgi:3'-phosphoadenosine 5'-phosphosulfate sulfotransferase (PAPS reductase)/FAD synthetase